MAKLILSPAPCTVRKAVGRKGWLVEGEIAVIRGKVVNRPFRAIRSTKAQAETEAAAQDRINAEMIAELEAETTAEIARVAERKAAKLLAATARAERKARQFAFDF